MQKSTKIFLFRKRFGNYRKMLLEYFYFYYGLKQNQKLNKILVQFVRIASLTPSYCRKRRAFFMTSHTAVYPSKPMLETIINNQASMCFKTLEWTFQIKVCSSHRGNSIQSMNHLYSHIEKCCHFIP